MFHAALALTLVLAAAYCASASAQNFVDIDLIDPLGRANTPINATSFKRQAITTVGDYQLTSYYRSDGKLVVGRRKMEAQGWSDWYLRPTEFTSYNINDAHNVSTIGVDGDGYLHMSWGLHNNNMLYTRSETSVLNDAPFTMFNDTVGNANFGGYGSEIPLHTQGITYPEFHNIPDTGDLLMIYRSGGSGNGDYHMIRWNNAADSWNEVRVGTPGNQPWLDNDYAFDSLPNANAYVNTLSFDSQNRLHATWTYRYGGDSPSTNPHFSDYQTNHHLFYAVSDPSDPLGGGYTTWRNQSLGVYQRFGTHDIDENNAQQIVSIPEGSSLINQSSMTVDNQDRPMAAMWWAPNATSGDHLRQYMLSWYDGANWVNSQVTNRAPENVNGLGVSQRVAESQLGTYWMSRPIVMVDEDDRVLLVYSDHQRGGGVTVAYTESPSRDQWEFVDLTTDSLGGWEPSYDMNRWQNDGVLSMLYFATGSTAAPISVLEWDARAYFAEHSRPKLTLQVNRQTGELDILNASGEEVAFTDYAIRSASGALNPGAWQTLAAQGMAGWTTSSATAQELSEANNIAPLALPTTASLELGAAFAPQYAGFGDPGTLDVAFEIVRSDGTTGTGFVQYIGGNPNTLTLRIDPATGRAEVENTSQFSVEVDGYSIASASGSLSIAGWESLDDQNAYGGDWHEADPNEFTLNELKVDGATLLEPGDVLMLGELFNAAGGSQDVQFSLLAADQSTPIAGTVVYETLGSPADFDEDGDVDGRDLLAWQRGLGSLDPNRADGDANGDGDVDAEDLQQWRQDFGIATAIVTTTVATPEPGSSTVLLGMAAAFLLHGSSRRPRQ